jgi:hypothetical protein
MHFVILSNLAGIIVPMPLKALLEELIECGFYVRVTNRLQ